MGGYDEGLGLDKEELGANTNAAFEQADLVFRSGYVPPPVG